MFNTKVFASTIFAAVLSVSAHAVDATGEDAANASPAASVANVAKPVLADLRICKPAYPLVSRQFEEQGTVRLQFKVGVDGQLISTKVLRSSGYSKLDNAAAESLSHCSFKAAMSDGKPIESTLAVDYVWALSPSYPRYTVKLGDLPLNKKYDELSDADKLKLRSMFDKLPEGDEPPFPANGLQEIVELVHDIENLKKATGTLSMDVEIAPNGQPQSVAVHSSPDRDLAKYVTRILMSAWYKPGMCNGTPCKMSLPFNFEFAIVPH